MTEDKSSWDSLYKEYAASLDTWKKAFDSFQKASADVQTKFNDVMQKAAQESSADTMKLFGQNWQKSLEESSMNSFKEFNLLWQKAMEQSTSSAYQDLGKSWQNSLFESGLQQTKAYGELMSKFGETWNNMWPKK